MDQKQIEALVQQVMGKLNVQTNGNGQHFTTGLNQSDTKSTTESKPYNAGSSAQSSGSVESCALDLGSKEVKEWIGVQHPNKPDVLKAFKENTAARVASGRAGVRPRTLSLIGFLADHSRSKDTVLKEVPKEWVEKHGLLEVQSEAKDKDQYLTRPDMGRVLSAESVELLKKNCMMSPDVQVIVCDGLSTDAVLANYDEILPPLMKGLESTGLKIGKPVFARYGRVKLEDHVGETLGAKAVVMLVGERPGLGQSESLSCYAVYNPTVKDTVEADRTCISNIHKAGTPPVEAAAVIVDLVKKMLDKKASGINLANKG